MSGPLRMFAGDTQDFTVTIAQVDTGDPYPLDGAKLWFVGKRSLDDEDERAVFFLTSDENGGIAVPDTDAGVAVGTLQPHHTESFTEPVTKLLCAWRIRDAEGRHRTIETFDLFVDLTSVRSMR